MRKPTCRSPGAAFLAALLLILPGCSSVQTWAARVPAPTLDARSVPTNVVVVRGSAEHWPDCDHFVGRLKAEGASTSVIRGWEVNRTANMIAAARKSGGENRPLVLIGYKHGANDAIRLTRRLQQHGVGVDTLVLMETAAQDSVPANVVSCLNVYKSSSVAKEWVPAFRGMPVTVESANTHLVNHNLRFHDAGMASTEIERVAVCQNGAVQEMIAARVAHALHGAPSVDEVPETHLAGGPWESGRRIAKASRDE